MGNQQRKTIAVFDFDGTLTARDTSFAFIGYAAGKVSLRWNLFVAALLAPVDLLLAILQELVGPQELRLGSVRGAFEMLFHLRVLRGALRGRSMAELERLGRDWAAGEMRGFLDDTRLARVSWHRDRGDSCYLVSASVDLYLKDWGEQAGFEAVLASKLASNDGLFSGRLDGPPCWGRVKLHRLKDLIGDPGDYEVYGYGDSRGDREFLAVADHSFVARGASLIPHEQRETF